MAVGRGVLTTCNYHARKFGCRSGMAAFVAKKLCPDLICLPPNYEKYTAKAKEIRAILERYDPQFEPASVDEAYMNITQYCSENNVDPQEAVQQLRDEISTETKVTVSAGIGPNAKIAKITSNWNKPNGQYYVPSDRSAIMSFMATLPVRKINGIGRVFERELNAIGVKTCGDIYRYRSVLAQLFGQKAFQFLMQCYLGLGRTRIAPADESQRKSVGTESTFRDLGGLENLQEKLRWTATELEKDMQRTQFKGRTLVLKAKLHTFEVISRQTVPPKAVCLADDLYKYSLPMLTKLVDEKPDMKLRLMGLRCTNLVSTKKVGLNFFSFRSGAEKSIDSGPVASSDDNVTTAEAEFEAAALEERQDEMNALEQLSQELEDVQCCTKDGREDAKPAVWTCPVCSVAQPADDTLFNEHVDFCLSRGTITEAVKDTLEDHDAGLKARKRTATIAFHSTSSASTNSPKRPFFG